MQELQTALLAAVVALVTALTPLLHRWLKSWLDSDTRSLRRHVCGFEQIAMLYRLFQSLSNLPYVGRVLILVGHNCGGPPRPDEPYWVRGLHGMAPDDKPDPTERYGFDMPVDAAYVRTLLQMIQKGSYEFHTESNVDKNSKLARLYREEGIKHSILYFLQISENRLLYFSVARYDDPAFSEDEKTEIEHWVDRLRAFLRQNN